MIKKVMLAFCLPAIVLLSACSDYSPLEPEELLIGTWELAEYFTPPDNIITAEELELSIIMTFEENGNFQIVTNDTLFVNGTYTINKIQTLNILHFLSTDKQFEIYFTNQYLSMYPYPGGEGFAFARYIKHPMKF